MKNLIVRIKEYGSSLWIEPVLFVLALLFAFASCVPWQPHFASVGLDPSWRLALHYFFAQGFQFGKDIVFTYGPYGFISTWTYYPDTYLLMFFAYIVLTGIYIITIWDIFKRFSRNPWIIFIATFGATVFLSPFPKSSFPGDTFFYAGGILFFIDYFMNPRKTYHISTFLLVAVLAAESLMKFTFTVLAFALISLATLDEIIDRRKPPVLLITFFAILLSLWLLARQSIVNFIAFFVTGIKISSGFGAVMCVYYPIMSDLFFYLAFAVVMLGTFYVTQWKMLKQRALLPAVGLTAILFLIFRGAFTRPDHSTMAMRLIPVLGIFLIPPMWNVFKFREWRYYLIALLITALTLGYAFGLRPFYRTFPNYVKQQTECISKMFYYAFKESRLTMYTKDLEREYAKIGRVIKHFDPIPRMDGTVDIYPIDCLEVIMQGERYRPRPVFHSYAAYNKSLAQANAEFLKSTQAPDFVLLRDNTTMGGMTIDGRFPTLDDSLSMPELMTRYKFIALTGQDKRFALLRKAPLAKTYTMIPIKTAEIKFGESVSVPDFDKGPVWVEIDMPLNLRGKIFAVLGRAGKVLITVKTKDGQTSAYSLLPTMSETGFLLSPLLNDNGSFLSFWTENKDRPLTGKEVTELKLEEQPHYQGFFKPRVTVRYFHLNT